MIYPKNIVKNISKIGVTATSAGFDDEINIKKLECAIENFKKLGYVIKETNNVRKTDISFASSDKRIRAKEFSEIYKDNEIDAVILAKGGDFLMEILEYIDFLDLKKATPKYIQGYSDSTFITYIFTTLLDICTVYSYNFSSFGMNDMHKSLLNSIKVLEGENILQESFEYFEGEYKEKTLENILDGFDLDTKVNWMNLNDEQEINVSGRIIGGCLDIILEIVGTKYDNTLNFIEKYREDGIVWYFESYDLSVEDTIRAVTKLKYAGYFKYVKAIIFGRPIRKDSCYGISYINAIKRATCELNVPIIIDACIGHRNPQMTILNGSIANISSSKGKGSISFKKI